VPDSPDPERAAPVNGGDAGGEGVGGEGVGRHLSCPFCASYEVDRLFVASVACDACECMTCRSHWKEAVATGSYRGSSAPASVIVRAG
jgi:hypothetical protein